MSGIAEKAKEEKKKLQQKVKDGLKGNKVKTIPGMDTSSEDEATSKKQLRVAHANDQGALRISSNGSRKVADYLVAVNDHLQSSEKPICLTAEDKAVEKLVKIVEQLKKSPIPPLQIILSLSRAEDLSPNTNTTRDRPILRAIVSKK